MNNSWSQLPNAKYIDHILADLKNNPSRWDAARDAVWDAAWAAAWDAAWDAVIALIAWDCAGSYLSLTPDKVKTLAYLGDNIAVLMLPAVTALEKEKELA